MKKLYNSFIYYLVIISATSLVGCGNYAKFIYESSPGLPQKDITKMTMEKLADEWDNYHVAYSGLRPPLSKGIIFDLKDDDKILMLEGVLWLKVTDEDTFRELIFWTAGPEKYNAQLFRIIGPSDQFFGYIYYSDENVSTAAKVIDQKTLSVYHIIDSMPPPFKLFN